MNGMIVLTKREEKQTRILDAAISEFARLGYQVATTAGIAREAGISQPYIYNFFGNKEELFVAALDKAWKEIFDAFQAIPLVEHDEHLEQKLIEAYERLAKDHKNETMLQMQAFVIPDSAIRSASQEQMTALKSYITNRFERAGIEDAPTRATNFIARGMLCNISQLIDMPSLLE